LGPAFPLRNLQGIYLNDKRTTSDSRKAVEAFEQAIRLDPNYARAWAGKAHAHRSFSNFGSRDANVHEEHQKSMEAINKALELDKNLSEAYSALCENKMYYKYDFAGAEASCKRAIELRPDSQQAHNIYARFLMGPGGRFDEAITEIKTAIDLDPAAFYHQLIYTIVLTYARRYDEADQQLERIAAMNPNGAVSQFWFVGGLKMQGNNSEAFEYLEKSYQERELWMAYLQVDPRLDSQRGDPRFDGLVRRVGLSQ
jgi:serine/threonine-protein kinase